MPITGAKPTQAKPSKPAVGIRTDTYDNLGACYDWARDTLEAHRGDKREFIYSREQLERGLTHDPLWNAAQWEMVRPIGIGIGLGLDCIWGGGWRVCLLFLARCVVAALVLCAYVSVERACACVLFADSS